MPDEARWVDLRGLLLSGRCRAWAVGDPAEGGEGLVARSYDHPFVSVRGEPSAALAAAVTAALAGGGEAPEVLAAPELGGWLGEILPGRDCGGVIFHRLPQPVPASAAAEPVPGFEIVRLAPDARPPAPGLGDLPPALRSEIATYLAQVRPLYAARLAGGSRLVSFCAAPLVTETLWDVSVETVDGFRRRGLAGACFTALASWMARERGLQPVWGAHADNPASLALAARLGFAPVAELVVLRPPARTSARPPA